MILAGSLKGKDPLHTFVLATNTENSVDLRTVVLRKTDVKNRLLYFHSDVRAPKVDQIRHTKEVAILFYDPIKRIQIRIKAKPFLHGGDIFSEELWSETRLSARKYYLSHKPPGSFLENAFDSLPDHLHGFDPNREESENGKTNFLVVSLHVIHIDWLFLCSQGHKRASFLYNENGYEGSFINP